MRKMFFVAVAVCSVLVTASCKSKDNLYKTAYDEARVEQSNEGQGQQSEAVEIAPVVSTTARQADVDDSYRTEKVVLSSGAAGSLKAFSVVCGSYSKKDGAESIRRSLVQEGYDAIVVQNPETGLYRVVCASYDSRSEAAQARARFKAAHPQNADYQKAWLLYNK
ncbi:MAG: SPOR domain-containing protein [Bacteroidaceae bacterium]|nr:SPOR domain-containing protein [Bacteroidaceae bacterium]